MNAFTSAGVSANSFDVGHFLSLGDAGGLAGGWPCDSRLKGRGGTAGVVERVEGPGALGSFQGCAGQGNGKGRVG